MYSLDSRYSRLTPNLCTYQWANRILGTNSNFRAIGFNSKEKLSGMGNANRYHPLITNDRQFMRDTFALVFQRYRPESYFKRVALAVPNASVRKRVAEW
jgi:hypothetical protein